MREVRKLRGYSRTELAAISGVSIQTIGNVERGDFEPRDMTLALLAASLDVDVFVFTNLKVETPR